MLMDPILMDPIHLEYQAIQNYILQDFVVVLSHINQKPVGKRGSRYPNEFVLGLTIRLCKIHNEADLGM